MAKTPPSSLISRPNCQILLCVYCVVSSAYVREWLGFGTCAEHKPEIHHLFTPAVTHCSWTLLTISKALFFVLLRFLKFHCFLVDLLTSVTGRLTFVWKAFVLLRKPKIADCISYFTSRVSFKQMRLLLWRTMKLLHQLHYVSASLQNFFMNSGWGASPFLWCYFQVINQIFLFPDAIGIIKKFAS